LKAYYFTTEALESHLARIKKVKPLGCLISTGTSM